MKKILTALFCSCLISPLTNAEALSDGLPPQAAGDYVFLDPHQNNTDIQFRLKLKGKQWLEDGSQNAGKSWSPVCEVSGECKLETSSKAEIERFFEQYPQVLNRTNVSCIHNMAFAFCGLTLDKKTDYVMVALVTNPPQATSYNRIK
ncbi:hypothetical protein [Aggregatibacter actinomycetemcomitans]|uniref:hypothetical protein n=1 Tax=Aggregatibacter actinomycetemcomitans TaxID=714 RepID=UPI0011D73D5A|nr:hypothetical protein [Aggregatibacter actinomycetemcomitans]TYB13633.1 hypothetical protein FXB65_09250 [Aggregatibacter actinomycetemcomitans]